MPALLLAAVVAAALAAVVAARAAAGPSGELPGDARPLRPLAGAVRIGLLPARAPVRALVAREKITLSARPAIGASSPAEQARTFYGQRQVGTAQLGDCQEWKWGFCVADVATDAAAANRAAVVAAIVDAILSWTGLSTVTDNVCLLFRFRLRPLRMPDGKVLWPVDRGGLGYARGNAALSAAIRDAHPAAASKVLQAQGRERIAWHVDPDGIYWVDAVDRDALQLWADTATIRRMLREDALDISDLASAQCGKGRWSFTTRAKARRNYT